MARTVAIYCCGGILKGPADKEKLVWSSVERKVISDILSPNKVVFLNPDERSDDITNAFTVFGRDHFQISVCDFVVADLRQKRGIGVGIEMLSAKLQGKPLVAVAPPNSHYRRSSLEYLGGKVDDYVHAHLFGIADVIIDDFESAGKWIKQFLENPKKIKDSSVIKQAMSAYKEQQLNKDTHMLNALKQLGKLQA
jgi:hypothetical protein